MGRRGRGREGLVRCEKCGRTTRRDKAVFIEKPMFTNPLERHQVEEQSTYRRAIFREVCYCVSCGKHGRIFEKKKRMLERQREREREWQARGNRRHYDRSRQRGYGQPHHASESAPQQSPEQKKTEQANPQQLAEETEVPPETAQ